MWVVDHKQPEIVELPPVSTIKRVVPVMVPITDDEVQPLEEPSDIVPQMEEKILEQPKTNNTIVDKNLPTKITDVVNRYESSRYRYAFDIPNNVYYSAFPPENGALHAIWIGKEDPETLSDSAVKVYYYGKKVLPELIGKEKVVDPSGTFVYLLINGVSFKIEALNINHPVVQKVIDTLVVL